MSTRKHKQHSYIIDTILRSYNISNTIGLKYNEIILLVSLFYRTLYFDCTFKSTVENITIITNIRYNTVSMLLNDLIKSKYVIKIGLIYNISDKGKHLIKNYLAVVESTNLYLK